MTVKLILSLISAAMLSMGWIGASGITTLVGFVPLLMIGAMYGDGRRQFWGMFGWVALTFGLWSGITTGWLWFAAPFIPFLSVGITIVLFGGIFMVYHYVSKRAPKALAYTILVTGWIACEYLYTLGEISFPWLTLGNGFANDIKLVQWYDTTGVFGGSLWVLIVNILIYEAITSRTASKWIASAFFIAAPITVSLIRYYTYTDEGKKITATVVQPNINPYMKWMMQEKYETELMLGLASRAPSDVDFIVLPETAITGGIVENNIRHNGTLRQYRDFMRENYPGAQMITGAETSYYYRPGERVPGSARYAGYGDTWYDVYNTALTIDTTGISQIHHKSILVVGVEKMPYYAVTKHLEWLIVDLGGTTGQHGTDPQPIVFTGPDSVRVGVPICWEAVFGYYCGEFVRMGAQALFVISNDGWWDDTRGHKQLFLYSRLRAVETRRSIGRSANTGTSGFINQRGDIQQKVGWNVQTAITDQLTLNDHITFYSRYGDYIARICSYVLALGILYFIAYRYKRRNKLVE